MTPVFYGEDEYKERVLSKSPKKPFEASLLWLVESEPYRPSKPLDSTIYAHRHDLTHELMTYIGDVDFEPEGWRGHVAAAASAFTGPTATL